MESRLAVKIKSHLSPIVLALALSAAGAVLVGPAVRAQMSARPITAANFAYHAPRGFGDRNNSWAHSMVWWNQHLYVGTGRQYACTNLYAIWQFVGGVIGLNVANTFFPYPPPDPDTSCPALGADLALQAEIWRWGPETRDWERVFQSPLELDNPGTGAPAPPLTGKKLPYEMSIRGMVPHAERDGTEALYAFGVNTTVMWDRSKLPPPRILRTTDGVNFVPIPQTPGTFLGDLPFNPDHSSFRSPVSYRGKLFVLSGPIFGQGSLIGSADPEKGDNAWFLASPPDLLFYETAVFNGWLYLGTFNPFSGGYSVVKTRAEGAPPYEFITVVPNGAFLRERPSKSVVSMNEYNGRLYVGTASQTELIRINADDTWDLVMGPPRPVPLPGGGVEWKYPLSGLDAGFGHSLNDHAWQMDDPYRQLYIGTYNAASASKDDPVNGPLLEHIMGAHLYRSPDGWYYSAITTNGFANLGDPHGGKFDYGIRSMATTPHGAFIGTVNDAYGLAILRAATRGSAAPDPPTRVEIEPTRSGDALLSWQAQAPPHAKYQIWRAEVHRIFVRDDINFENWNGPLIIGEIIAGSLKITGNKVPDTYIGPYQLIGTTQNPIFLDSTVEAGKRYMYYVVVETGQGVSDQSNLVAFPLLIPPVTFAQLQKEVDRWQVRRRFVDAVSGPTRLRQLVLDAQSLAAACQRGPAIKTLNAREASNYLLDPEATDAEILISKLARRLALFGELPWELSSSEFCTFSTTTP